MDIRKTLWIANLGLAALLAYFAVGVIARTDDADVLASVVVPEAEAEVTGLSPPLLTFQESEAIVDRNVFGVNARREAAPSPPGEPRFAHNLELVGTIAGDSGVSRAVIEDLTAQHVRVYRVGDSVQDARIVSIERGRVFLARGSQREVLEIAVKLGAGGAASPAAQASSQQAPLPPSARGDSPPSPGRLAAYSLAVGMAAGPPPSPGRLAAVRRPPFGGVGGVAAVLRWGEMRPQAVGRTVGLRVSGVDDSLSRFSGLKNGDVILSINDESVGGNIDRARDLLRKARAEGKVELKLLRDGKEETIFSKA